MKSNEKRLILILIVILVIVIGIKISRGKKNNMAGTENTNQVVVQSSQKEEEYVNLLADGTKINTSKALAKDRKFQDLDIKDIHLIKQDGTTMLIANVENNTAKATERKKIALNLLDEKGQVMITIKGIIDAMEPGGTFELNIGVTSDFANAYDFEIEELN